MENFIGNLFFSALGALLGIIGGAYYQEKKEEDLLLRQSRRLRFQLLEVFRFNVGEMTKMRKMLLEEKMIPDFYLDSEAAAHILFHGRELFQDCTWFDKFNWERYQFVHINAQVDFLNSITNLKASSLSEEVVHQRFGNLVGNLNKTIKDVEALLLEYKQCNS